jgi:hypothetical protein
MKRNILAVIVLALVVAVIAFAGWFICGEHWYILGQWAFGMIVILGALSILTLAVFWALDILFPSK